MKCFVLLGFRLSLPFESFSHALCIFLSNHLIRPGEHVRRNRQADLLRGLEVDHKLELRGLLHRQIGRFGAFQDLVHVDCRAPVEVVRSPRRST